MYTDALTQHYEEAWARRSRKSSWAGGPIGKDLPNFTVLVFEPSDARTMWTYATCGMSESAKVKNPIEVHIFSKFEDNSLSELLSAVAHYHNFGEAAGLAHTVNFGRPWQPGSGCSHGLISLPYLDGPRVEAFAIDRREVRCLWIIPITPDERQFKTTHGVEKLEERFDSSGFDYANPHRMSVL